LPPPEREPVDLRPVLLGDELVLRLAPPLLLFEAAERALPDLEAPPDDLAEERVPELLLLPAPLERDDVERELLLLPDERDPPPVLLERDEPLLLLLLEPSIENFPDMTRCAASATASAISEPSLVALDITDLAALSAVSAASMPASLIALRAFGLALIAAAAAARPAASISLLIAALASFSVVDFEEPEDDDRDEPDPDFVEFDDLEPVRLLDFAIANLPLVGGVDTQVQQQFRCGRENALEIGESAVRSRYVKGDRRVSAIPSNMVSGRK
jgi:hypothetical protein